MIRPPPRSTLFPYTPLFRSNLEPPQSRADLVQEVDPLPFVRHHRRGAVAGNTTQGDGVRWRRARRAGVQKGDRKSTRLNSSHSQISYAVFCLKKKKKKNRTTSPATIPSSPIMRRPIPAAVPIIGFVPVSTATARRSPAPAPSRLLSLPAARSH